MKSRCIAVLAFIFALLLALLAPGAILGCIPVENDTCLTTHPATSSPEGSTTTKPGSTAVTQSNRVTLQRDLTEFANRGKTVSALAPELAPPTIGNADVPRIVPQDEWVYISANEKIWFQVGDSLRNMTIGLDVGDETGLDLAVYSPEQGDVFNARPIGNGTRENGYDLWWSGAARGKGPWYVKFQNRNEYSVPYKVAAKTKTDSGIEYIPQISFAFGTGEINPVSQTTTNQPVQPPPAAPVVEQAPVAPQPPSDNPGGAQEPNGESVFISPGQTYWYKMFSRQRLYVWVDTGGHLGVELAIFPPGTTDFWGTRPVGLGSKNKNEGHDLFWTGRAPGAGEWYARVTNKTDISIPITVDFTRVNSRLKDFCTSCHGDEFDFETCESNDPAFCEEFLPGLLKQ